MPQKSNFGSPPAKPGVYLGEIIIRPDTLAGGEQSVVADRRHRRN